MNSREPTMTTEQHKKRLEEEAEIQQLHDMAVENEDTVLGVEAIVRWWDARLRYIESDEDRLDEIDRISASLPQLWQLQAEPGKNWLHEGIPLEPGQIEPVKHWLRVRRRKLEERMKQTEDSGMTKTEVQGVRLAKVAKIKVECSQRQFVLLIGESYRTGVFKMSEDRNVPWAEACKHFCKSDGSEFNPKDLASEWSKIGKGGSVQGGAEIIKRIERASGASRPSRRSAEPFTGSLSESGVLEGLPVQPRTK